MAFTQRAIQGENPMAQTPLSSMSPLEVEERDQAGHAVSRYLITSSQRGGSVSIIVPGNSKSLVKTLLSAFLPAGYPHSVTKDYLEYQIYDSLQAFSSSIAGLLSSRAVLEGVGVGDANASPTAALLLSVLQDSMGRIATILFAHKLGTSLEPECKMYRLTADIFNDAAIILDCLSPTFPKTYRVMIFSLSSVLRALCGVAAGSSKASLSAHFATQGNLGELNAKDSSQETIISLLGMLAGSLIVSRITTTLATWSALIFLLFVHLWTNYRAVRAVSMRTLSRQRANIVFSNYLDLVSYTESYDSEKSSKQVEMESFGKYSTLTPEEVSQKERIFELDGVIRWRGGTIIGICTIGIPLGDILPHLPLSMHDSQLNSYIYSQTPPLRKALNVKINTNFSIEALFQLFAEEEYVLYCYHSHHFLSPPQPRFAIILKKGADVKSQLKSWFHAVLCARRLQQQKTPTELPILDILRETLEQVEKLWGGLVKDLSSTGWDTKSGALETRSGTRASLVRKNE